MIKAVVFDYGGTLFQPRRPWQEMKPEALLASYRYLRRHGLKISNTEYLKANARVFDRYLELEAAKERDISDRIKYFDLVGELFPGAAKRERARLASGASDSFWRVVNDNYRPGKNAKACLRELQAMRLKLGIISNHHDRPSLMRSLRSHRLASKFDPIVVSEAVDVRKPNPAIFRVCLSAMRTSPKETIYVGDSRVYDVAGARAAGMPSVLVGTPDADGPEPDFTVEELGAIPPIVANLNEIDQGT